ncbi:DUF3500 domain-containing protein [Allorhodopirellula heiligendammensis]|uniref:DUF3500 domain-containing protein n=1 Tax=Allorhodopirellula heiligendammensis TaxID=2714739 RepID=A0A5C6BTT7_9BACT|nr:DUF3500 domain-containing protein [Allorhodopirellula heiligendammensis]TWU15262.1 hypothetical protein Poly21_24570 [Allorhodopirellula heiligendammensis]
MPPINRRELLQTGSLLGAASLAPALLAGTNGPSTTSAESLTQHLYESLSPQQRKEICFDWNHQDPQRGLLRTHVANNWNITRPSINDDFYTADQQQVMREIFEAIINPEWHERYDQQLEDDMGGFGYEQSIAIFGTPNDGKFELVLTGRHMTLRCDGNSTDHVAFGGPIFYGHAPDDQEDAAHTGNVFWSQAVAANGMYKMLDGRQQAAAQVQKTPREQLVGFRDQADLPGLPVSDMSSDQREHLQGVLKTLIEPYRHSDQDEVVACLKAQGGLDACRLMYFTDHDIGKDGVWDNWRLEGPSFVWHYRGAPHVHVWVNVADDPKVKLNAS